MADSGRVQSFFAAQLLSKACSRLVFLVVAVGSSALAWGTTCTPVISGYTVGAGVTYVVKDTANPSKGMEKPVPKADPASFEVLRQPSFEKGPCAGQRVESARDKNHVYYRWQVVPGADPQTYVFIDDQYARDKSAVYAGARRLTTRVSSFRRLGAYATDGKTHFYQDAVIAGPGFRLLGGDAQAARGYAATDLRVYHDGRIVDRADPKTFELFKPEVGITRDKRFVYFNDLVIPGADPKTFEQINGYTFKDKAGVYTEGQKIIGTRGTDARASEFGSYVIDGTTVYKQGKPLAKRDAATFIELQPQWTKDKTAVYYQDEPVPQIDVATFKTTSLNRGEDRNYRYEGLRKVCKFQSDGPQTLPLCP
jgi:DKNYY family